MFKKKPKEQTSMDAKQVAVEDSLKPYKQPMVFLFDFEEAVVEKLKEIRINSYEGSFGSTVKVNNKNNEKKFLKLNRDYPANLHEFDIVMLDLTKNKSENYDPNQHQLSNTSGNTAHVLLSAYPEQIFDPRPLSINIVSKDLDDLFEKKTVIIAFCGSENISEYQYVEITGRGADITGREKLSNFSFYQNFPS